MSVTEEVGSWGSLEKVQNILGHGPARTFIREERGTTPEREKEGSMGGTGGRKEKGET